MNANTNSANRAIVSGRQAAVDGGFGQLTPRHPRTDAIGRQQRVHGSPLTRLAATEFVGAVERRRQRRAGIGVV